MKNIFFIILNCIYFISNGQIRRFIYEYTTVPDSTNSINKKTNIMYLDISQKGSGFFDGQKYISDSTLTSMAKKNQFMMPPRDSKFIDYRITKEYPSYKLTFLVSTYNKKLSVIDIRKQLWHIEKNTDKYKGFSIQKATTNFAGRKWVAWFTSDIPIPDGPYKFYGLPGLILKLEDNTGSHKFNLIGIKNNIPDYNYPILNTRSPKIDISFEKYIEIYKEYRRDPAKDYRIEVMKGNIFDSLDDNGNIETPQQKLKELDALLKNKIKKDNNILELDLLK
ncbi:GLPGLI family protein [Elizabethkingia occulta]|nr:GLPGLI family protein [Elizabethkingia occulta]